MGAIANYFTRVTSKGRLRLEAQAYCAQAFPGELGSKAERGV